MYHLIVSKGSEDYGCRANGGAVSFRVFGVKRNKDV